MGESAVDFTGSIPDAYDRHLGPVLFEPFADELATRLPAGERVRVLELACGTGIVTRRLRDALHPSASLVATDLNQAMVDHARGALGDLDVAWQVADAQELPFADGSFDVVVCQFGFMFLPDKARGFREARRVLADGGLLLVSVWQSIDANPVAAALQRVLTERFAADPPRFLGTPYGYHERERHEADVRAGGFEDVRFDDVRLRGAGPSAAHFAYGWVHGSPLRHELVERGGDDDELVDVITAAFIDLAGDSPFTPELAATVITARR
jgi:SAM-dependent methyltransferase